MITLCFTSNKLNTGMHQQTDKQQTVEARSFMFSFFSVLHTIPSAVQSRKGWPLIPPWEVERSHCQARKPGTAINSVYCNLPDTLAEHVAKSETRVSNLRHVYWCEALQNVPSSSRNPPPPLTSNSYLWASCLSSRYLYLLPPQG